MASEKEIKNIKAERVAQVWVENGGGSLSKAMRDVGYKDGYAKNPAKMRNSKGFKDACARYGLTDELVLTALRDDIKAKPQNRVGELNLAAKVKGMFVEGETNQTNILILPTQAFSKYELTQLDNE